MQLFKMYGVSFLVSEPKNELSPNIMGCRLGYWIGPTIHLWRLSLLSNSHRNLIARFTRCQLQ